MDKILFLLMILLALPLFAQEYDEISEFHRLLIFNAKNEIMVAKIKNTDYWVTPGLYSKNKALTNNNLYKLAANYGLTVTQPKLRGKFILNNNKGLVSNRTFFKVNVSGGDLKKPNNIEELNWLPLNDALKVITFPHINMLIKQIMDYPDVVWGGTVLRYKENNTLKSKMTTDFYPLNTNSD